jgi:hypothetical protein
MVILKESEKRYLQSLVDLKDFREVNEKAQLLCFKNKFTNLIII